MNNNFFVQGGLNFDRHETLRDKDSHVWYIRNGDISDFSNSNQNAYVQNALSNELCAAYPPGMEFKGSIKLDLNYHIIFFANTLLSGIYLLDDSLCTLTKIVEDPCLDFKEMVTGVFRYKGNDRVIYFVEKNKPPRYLNIDKPYPKKRLNTCSDCDQIDLDVLDCSKLNVFPCYEFPNIKVEKTEGNIPDGVYQFAIKLDNSEFYILKDTFNVHALYLNKERYGFQLTIDCIDESISEYQIALISQREDRGTVAQIVGTYSSESKSVVITEIDAPNYKPIDLEYLFLSQVKYSSAEHISTNSEHLVLGKLKDEPAINYQPIANDITAEVVVTKVPADKAHLYPTFMSDEVYAIYIQHVICGKHTEWYHVPNQTILKDEWDTIVSNKDTWKDDCNPINKKYWEVYNTAELTQVIEENDNGYTEMDTIPVYPSNCHKYTLNTRSKYWEVTVTYKDCLDPNTDPASLTVVTGLAKDINICTADISTASFSFRPFNKQTDVQRVGTKGKCTPNNAPSTDNLVCSKFKLSSIYSADFNDTNYGEIVYNSCTQTVDPADNSIVTEVCDSPIVSFAGDISPLTFVGFCACDTDYSDDNIEFDITLVPDPDTVFQQMGPCDFNMGDMGSPDSNNCDYSIVAKANFAYWESKTPYPTTPAFEKITQKDCTIGIKHHKFPDRTQTLDGKHFPHIHNETANCNAKEYVYPMAIQLKNVQPPVDCNGKPVEGWQGYRIGVAKRNNYKSIIHKGLIHNMRQEDLQDCTESFFPNYPFNDLNPDVFLGSKELIRLSGLSGTLLPTGSYIGTYVPMSKYSKKKFQYLSPNIQYVQNDNTATELITYCEENGYLEGRYNQTKEFHSVVVLEDGIYDIIIGITLAAIILEIIPLVAGGADAFSFITSALDIAHNLTDGSNYAFNITEKSNYTRRRWNNIIPTNRRRKILTSQYLQAIKQNINGTKINNYNRENSLFLSLNDEIENPFLSEKSRITYSEVKSLILQDCSQNKYRTSCYYVGLKRDLPNQYGKITDPLVRPISNIITTTQTPVLFGGDVWITKHTSNKKFPFFVSLPLGLPYDSPFTLSSELNVGFPRYWMDVNDRSELKNFIVRNTIGRLVQSVTSTTDNTYYLDSLGIIQKGSCGTPTKTINRFGPVDGGFYTHIIGTLEYYCESEFIGPYRERNELPQSTYYPITDYIDFQPYDFIKIPEQFIYNLQHRNFGITSKNSHSSTKLDCCNIDPQESNKIIFSTKSDPFSYKDKWLEFLPNNFHQFLHQDGNLTTIHSIDNYNLLFLFDNAAYVTQTEVGIYTDKGVQYLGQGSIFQNKIRKISNEETGLGGCIDKYSVINTPTGVYWADRNRKRFISYTDRIADWSVNMESWFQEYMNNPIIGIYDSFSKNIYWSDKNWTISHKSLVKNWVSFHDFIPDFYTRSVHNFLSFKGGVWKHNVKNKYQTYYGKEYPFEVAFTVNEQFKHNKLDSIEVFSEFYTHAGYNSKVRNPNIFFDSLFVWNDYMSTGIKPLYLKDKDNPNDYLIQKDYNSSIEVTNVKFDNYRINGFKNFAEGQPLITWDTYKYKPLNVNEKLISEKNGLPEGKWFNIHFISHDVKHKKLIQLDLNINAELQQ